MLGESEDILDGWLRDGGRALLDALTVKSAEVFGVIDRARRLRWVNWTTRGLSRDAVLGRNAFDLIPPDYVETARAAFDAALDEGKPSQFEMMFIAEGGVIAWSVRLSPIVHAGRVVGAFTTNTDVTAERREFLDRDRFFALSLDMLVVATPEGAFRRVNAAFEETVGYTNAELAGRAFRDFVHPADRDATRAAYQRVVAGAPGGLLESRFCCKGGEYRALSWNSKRDPLTGDVYAVARDVTEQRATEAQLRHSQKMEAVGQLAGGVAHDFNNLMQAVLANAELAATTPGVSAELAEYLREIEGAGRRAAELTKQLLVFSRRHPLRRQPLSVSELVLGMQKLLQRLLPENIAFDLHAREGLPAVSCDRSQLEQVLLNLCVNARDAMEHGGKLTVETDVATFSPEDCELNPWARPGRFVRLSVADTGVGMSAEVRERIFDPFFSTKEPGRGTGLGLATVYGIVQQHGGVIHVYSEPGHGTTFKVYLPAEAYGVAVAPEALPTEPPRARGQETILLAEDELFVLKPVVQLLEKAGYRVLTADNGLQAVAAFERHRAEISLVLLDVVMPELGGAEAWQRIAAIAPDTKVLFTSGYADAHHRQRLPDGAEVVDKPFRTVELLERVRHKLDE